MWFRHSPNKQIQKSDWQKHSFLYHLGNIVYNHDEAHEYPQQFLIPYDHYPKPVFAIAGNHDGDINPDNNLAYESLGAFMLVEALHYAHNSRAKQALILCVHQAPYSADYDHGSSAHDCHLRARFEGFGYQAGPCCQWACSQSSTHFKHTTKVQWCLL